MGVWFNGVARNLSTRQPPRQPTRGHAPYHTTALSRQDSRFSARHTRKWRNVAHITTQGSGATLPAGLTMGRGCGPRRRGGGRATIRHALKRVHVSLLAVEPNLRRARAASRPEAIRYGTDACRRRGNRQGEFLGIRGTGAVLLAGGGCRQDQHARADGANRTRSHACAISRTSASLGWSFAANSLQPAPSLHGLLEVEDAFTLQAPVHAAMSMHIRPRPFLLICSGPVARFATAVVAPAASASASGALQIARGPSARPPATTTWARCSGLAAQKREADPARRDHVGDSEDLLLDHVGDRLRDDAGDKLTWFT